MAHLDLTQQHAFIVTGAKDEALTLVNAALAEHQLPTQSHPDFFMHNHVSFGVDDAREVSKFLSEKSTDNKKVVVIASTFFNSHAQNALLKTIEDPLVEMRIFFIVDSTLRILPTVLSRTVTHTVSQGEPFLTEAQELLGLTKPERLARISLFLDMYDDEENHNRMREAAHALFSTLIRVLHKEYTKVGTYPMSHDQLNTLEKISYCTESILDNGSGVKMLCEAILLLIPEVSETKS